MYHDRATYTVTVELAVVVAIVGACLTVDGDSVVAVNRRIIAPLCSVHLLVAQERAVWHTPLCALVARNVVPVGTLKAYLIADGCCWSCGPTKVVATESRVAECEECEECKGAHLWCVFDSWTVVVFGE